MPATTALAIFFLIWWVVLFAVLPFGVRSQHESPGDIVPGTDPGAPAIPHLLRKLCWTTLVSLLIFAVCCVVYLEHLIPLASLAAAFGAH